MAILVSIVNSVSALLLYRKELLYTPDCKTLLKKALSTNDDTLRPYG